MAGRMTRRTVLKGGLIGVPAVAVAGGGGMAWLWATADVDTFGRVPFRQRLTIPPLADAEIDGGGRRVFELAARPGTSELLPGVVSDTWGFNGGYLGPTLRADRGEQVQVNVGNELGEATTVHWHGMHLPAAMDGGPHQMVAPGETWSPTWEIDQPAATLWYHPHPHGDTRDHVNRGLAGLFILDDPDNPASGELPHEYGVDDIPLIVQDRNISDSGELRTGNVGDMILVNGTFGPFLDVTTEAIRLRLLNASNARVYNLGFSDDREFSVVGSDGGLLPAPVDLHRLALSPGERAEIVVRMCPGENVVLRSYQPDLGVNWFTNAFDGGKDLLDLLELRAGDNLAPSGSLPQTLGQPPDLIDASDVVPPRRRFELQGNAINGLTMDMGRIDEVVHVDSTEIWEVANTDGDYHNFHVHGVQFQMLDVNGGSPPPAFAGWKDTVFLQPGDTVRIAMRFTKYTDPSLPYMFHCHRLRHEDRGMMGQFVVVEHGQQPAPPSRDDTDNAHIH
jgi:FtsP/CotA-like multicopper oxidase with cupredoxin domain